MPGSSSQPGSKAFDLVGVNYKDLDFKTVDVLWSVYLLTAALNSNV